MERANHTTQGQEHAEREARPAKKAMQPPLTPMIDVVFQLLLFFLLACQFRQVEAAIPANLPEIGHVPPGPVPDPIRITILPAGPDRRGAIYRVGHDGQVLEGPAELYARLALIRRSIPGDELGVVISPGRQVRWRHVVEAMNQSVRAEYRKVAFATAHDGAEQGNGI